MLKEQKAVDWTYLWFLIETRILRELPDRLLP